jgi:hypothetical protein
MKDYIHELERIRKIKDDIEAIRAYLDVEISFKLDTYTRTDTIENTSSATTAFGDINVEKVNPEWIQRKKLNKDQDKTITLKATGNPGDQIIATLTSDLKPGVYKIINGKPVLDESFEVKTTKKKSKSSKA